MSLVERIGDTIVSVGKDVSQKAREASGIAKLKINIRAKEDYIKEQYLELGKLYYEKYKNESVEEQQYFDRIEEALDDIAQMEQQILELKNIRRCPECGSEVTEEAGYCSVCGAKLSAEKEVIFEEEEIIFEEEDESAEAEEPVEAEAEETTEAEEPEADEEGETNHEQ